MTIHDGRRKPGEKTVLRAASKAKGINDSYEFRMDEERRYPHIADEVQC